MTKKSEIPWPFARFFETNAQEANVQISKNNVNFKFLCYLFNTKRTISSDIVDMVFLEVRLLSTHRKKKYTFTYFKRQFKTSNCKYDSIMIW